MVLSLTCILESTWVMVSSDGHRSLPSLNLWKFLSGWMLYSVACGTLESLYKGWVGNRVAEHLPSKHEARCGILNTAADIQSQHVTSSLSPWLCSLGLPCHYIVFYMCVSAWLYYPMGSNVELIKSICKRSEGMIKTDVKSKYSCYLLKCFAKC